MIDDATQMALEKFCRYENYNSGRYFPLGKEGRGARLFFQNMAWSILGSKFEKSGGVQK